MSEYQYHEWQTVDRPLTNEEIAAVNRLSSHIEVSPTRAVVTYHWSDFRHDPEEVLLRYFDAYFYLANWGTLHLMFRFPKGAVDEAGIMPYCDGEFVTFSTKGEYSVLGINYNPEDGAWDQEPDAQLADFIQLRADILQGDYRLLYLAWLKSRTMYGLDSEMDYFEDEDESEEDQGYYLEPPVPAGLKKLSASLQNFADVFDVDPFLIQAAAEASPNMQMKGVNYRELVSRLSRQESVEFLARLAEGDAGVGMALRTRLREYLPKEPRPDTGSRSIEQLIERAKILQEAAEKRQAEEARRKHIAAMESLAEREPNLWQEVDKLLENGQKIASVYDQATQQLESLKQLADYQEKQSVFRSRARKLAEKYASRPSLIKRWQSRGWL